MRKGASIACSGVALTITSQGEEGTRRWFTAEVSPETLSKTTSGTWKIGARINLERALKMGDALGGHFVTGHVDRIARIMSRENAGEYVRFVFKVPVNLAPFVATKGSVALDGVSLTVNRVNGMQFDSMLIPAHTTSRVSRLKKRATTSISKPTWSRVTSHG